MTTQQSSFVLGGGLDLVTPPLEMKPGRAIMALNYEALPRGGYKRIAGYRRYDGQYTSPTQVPGEGPITGLFVYKNALYVFRDHDMGGFPAPMQSKMYKATSGGWVEVQMPIVMKFINATSDFESLVATGATITGDTSGATADIRGWSRTGTDPVAGDYGYLALENVTGVFLAAEPLTISATVIADSNSVPATYTRTALTVSSVYHAGMDFVVHNFGVDYDGSGSEMLAYGADGRNPPFEFDGDLYMPLAVSGNPPFGSVYPRHVARHLDYLAFGFSDGRAAGLVILSSLGKPRDYISTSGAAAIHFGDAVRALKSIRGGLLFVGCKETTHLLYGTVTANFEKKQFTDHGVRTGSVQEIGGGIVAVTPTGLQQLTATQAFGDYASLSLSTDIQPMIGRYSTIDYYAGGFEVGLNSAVDLDKDRYMLFGGSGRTFQGLYVTFNGTKVAGIMPVLFAHSVSCMGSGPWGIGARKTFFGSEAGFVYEMGGSTFDETDIASRLMLAFNTLQRPRNRKRFGKIVVDVKTTEPSLTVAASVTFTSNVVLDWNQALASVPPDEQVEASGSLFWGQSMWVTTTPVEIYNSQAVFEIDTNATVVALDIQHDGADTCAPTLYSATVHYDWRREQR